jgi:hypothetical protein
VTGPPHGGGPAPSPSAGPAASQPPYEGPISVAPSGVDGQRNLLRARRWAAAWLAADHADDGDCPPCAAGWALVDAGWALVDGGGR